MIEGLNDYQSQGFMLLDLFCTRPETVGSLGVVTHTMVKDLSCGKFAVVNIYLGKLYQGDLRLHVNLFTMVDFHLHAIIIFPGNSLEGLQTKQDFRFQKTVDIQEQKNKTQMVQVKFLKFQNQVNKRVNPNSNLPSKKYKRGRPGQTR